MSTQKSLQIDPPRPDYRTMQNLWADEDWTKKHKDETLPMGVEPLNWWAYIAIKLSVVGLAVLGGWLISK